MDSDPIAEQVTMHKHLRVHSTTLQLLRDSFDALHCTALHCCCFLLLSTAAFYCSFPLLISNSAFYCCSLLLLSIC